MTLPTVLMTDVIRSSHQGDSHGGAYLINLETREHRQVIDWNRVDINWEGRGAGRGLRGIAFVGDEIYIAASDELFVFDRAFNIVRSHTCAYLHHCHEISYDGDRSIYLTSTSHDSVLRFDTVDQRFVEAQHLKIERRGIKTALRATRYDPNGDEGPERKDTIHLNQVIVLDGSVYCSMLRLGVLWRLGGDMPEPVAPIPAGTHNTRPLGDSVLMNATSSDCVLLTDTKGKPVRRFDYPTYGISEMTNTDLGDDYARQGFGRGLCLDPTGGIVIVGSSPGTVSAFDIGTGDLLSSVNVSKDIRNAPHGLEVWPYAD